MLFFAALGCVLAGLVWILDVFCAGSLLSGEGVVLLALPDMFA